MPKNKKSCLISFLIQAAFFIIGIFPILRHTYSMPGLDTNDDSLIAPLAERFSVYSAIFSEPFKGYYGFFLLCALVCGVALLLLAVFGLFTERFSFRANKLLAAAQLLCFGVPVWFTETAGAILFFLLIFNFAQLTLYENHWAKTARLKIFNAVLWSAEAVLWLILMLVGFGFFPLQ